MTAAAFSGTFADFRIVKTRKLAQFVIEVPLEAADDALKALGGLPRSDQERWVAVARLQDGRGHGAGGDGSPAAAASEADAAPARRFSQEAGRLCKDKRFRMWLERAPELAGTPFVAPLDSDDAAACVRRFCKVRSRSEFDTDFEAAVRWRKLRDRYMIETGLAPDPERRA